LTFSQASIITMVMKRRPSFLGVIALLLPFKEVSSLSLESSSASSVSSSASSASSLLLSRRRALASVAVTAGGVSSAFWPCLVSPVLAAEPDKDTDALIETETATSASDYFPFESRDRNNNKNTVIREDYWYMMGKTPPRQLLRPLKGDNPAFNAFGSCESAVTGGGNPCTYISLTQRAPAYSKYASSITVGSQEYGALGRLLQQLRTRTASIGTDTSDSMDASWQEAASYVVTQEHSPPPPIVDAELKMVLFATAMTTSPNFPGPSRELLVSRFYVNEAHYAHIVMKQAIANRDVDAALQAWQFGRDSWNSYFQAVSRSIVPKVGEPFAPIAAMV
jgi:hypothetical protein